MNTQKLLDNAVSYLSYLEVECGLYVSVHFALEVYETADARVISALMPYIMHKHPYCRFVREEISHDTCIANQQSIIASVTSRDPFENVCHAGVRELIYPIMRGGATLGFATVSGYKSECTGCYDRELYKTLSVDGIPRRLTDTLLPPLCMMIEELLCERGECDSSEFNLILSYLAENHTHFTLDGIAAHFGRSRSHISHLFKKNAGQTLRAYCNSLKLSDAAKLLSDTDLSVTEIALECGFDAPSYFIQLFRNSYGITPHKYREKHR